MEKMRKLLNILIGACLVFMHSSCKFLYPNLMFRQKDYQYFEMAQKVIDEYVIEPGDEMTIKVYTRDGFSIIDYSITAEGNVSVSGVSQETFIVDPEGFLTVPIIGDLYVKGYTERQLEKILADKLSGIYINPFVSVRVTNRRVYVFRGGEGSVVNINQTPTTLIEVIARSRGVSNDFKSYNIKLIRGDLKNPQIFLIDLSTIEGMRKSNLIVQSNDIIYIEPRRNVASSLFNIVFPFTTLANTFVSIIALSIALGNR